MERQERIKILKINKTKTKRNKTLNFQKIKEKTTVESSKKNEEPG